jgi:hypothetical protein
MVFGRALQGSRRKAIPEASVALGLAPPGAAFVSAVSVVSVFDAGSAAATRRVSLPDPMAGGARNRTIGVGPLLRSAREVRGLSIDEAARDTKLPAEQLNALEDEDFAALLGDVYVRASLRTYAVYLGIDPDEVTAIYSRQADEPAPTPPPTQADRATRVLAASRLRDNPRLVVLGATTILVVLIAFGILSRSDGTPAPAPIATAGADPNASVRPIDVAIDAKSDTTVTVTIDGRVETFAMSADESRSFTAQRSLRLEVADGASLHVVENGHDLGVPGAAGSPWSHVWTNETGNAPSPSA